MKPYTKPAKVFYVNGHAPHLNNPKRTLGRWQRWYYRKAQRSAARWESKREIWRIWHELQHNCGTP